MFITMRMPRNQHVDQKTVCLRSKVICVGADKKTPESLIMESMNSTQPGTSACGVENV